MPAQGATGAFPEADGIGGARGGGGLEWGDIAGEKTRRYTSMPLGPLRLGVLSADRRPALIEKIDAELRNLDWLTCLHGRPICAVGGAGRSLARSRMSRSRSPLEVIPRLELDPPGSLDNLYR